MRWRVSVALSVSAVLLLGCRIIPRPVSSTALLGREGPVVVEIWASNGCVEPGDTVKLRATTTNKTSRVQTFESTDRPVLDIEIGGEVWSALV